MLGDTAVAVHPDDERYKALIGKQVRLPLVGRLIPIIADEYTDPEEGYGRGQDHAGARLQRLRGRQAAQPAADQIFTRDGASSTTNVPEAYRGLDRFEPRAQEDRRAISRRSACSTRSNPTRMTVPYGDRSNVVIEPI